MAAVTTATKILPSSTVLSTPWNDIVQEMIDAKGAYATLKARVDALTAAPSSEFVESGQTPTFVSTTQFTVPTNLTTKFEVGRRIQAELTAGTLVYSRVTVVSFVSNTTTVTLVDAVLTSALSKVWYSFWGVGSDRAYPDLIGPDFPSSQAQGDVLIRGATVWERLGAGTSGQFLKTQGAVANPIWVSGVGPDFPSSQAQGDVLIRGATVWERLGAGTSGQFLKTQGAAANPIWSAVSGAIPTGSKMFFGQASAPTGWTQDVDQTDRVLRVVSGLGAGVGGTWTTSHTHTFTDVVNHVHSIDPPSTAASITDPGHLHSIPTRAGTISANPFVANSSDSVGTAVNTGTNTTGITASVDIAAFNSANPTGGVVTGTTAGQSVNGDSAWRPAYFDIIKCTLS